MIYNTKEACDDLRYDGDGQGRESRLQAHARISTCKNKGADGEVRYRLSDKLGAMGYIPISQPTGQLLDTIGVWAFFVVIGTFSFWVIGTFFKNIGVLKGEEVQA